MRAAAAFLTLSSWVLAAVPSAAQSKPSKRTASLGGSFEANASCSQEDGCVPIP
jgi:hypothetical protein